MKSSTQPRILIVEDEPHIAEGLKLNLSLQGYAVKIAMDGVSGLDHWRRWGPDLIVLDIMLPGIDGISVLQSIRLEDERIPILILSAKATPADKISGFTHGVDDYLAKPFDLEEFILRVDRLLKRFRWANAEAAPATSLPDIFEFGDNRVDLVRCTADCQQGQVSLTEQEIKLLKLFIRNQGKPLSRRDILQIGWGYTGGMTTRTVDNFIVRFRKYFEVNPKRPVYFKSIRSVGYQFSVPEDPSHSPEKPS